MTMCNENEPESLTESLGVMRVSLCFLRSSVIHDSRKTAESHCISLRHELEQVILDAMEVEKVSHALNKENVRLLKEIEDLNGKVGVLKEMNAIQRHKITTTKP